MPEPIILVDCLSYPSSTNVRRRPWLPRDAQSRCHSPPRRRKLHSRQRAGAKEIDMTAHLDGDP